MSLPTPSPYSLQGMSEKIHFQRFVRQHLLQLGDLPTSDQLAGSRMGRVYFFESIAPVVKQSSRYPKLSRKPEYVVAGLHLLESLASKLVTVSLPFLSLHFATPFSQSVHHKPSHSRGSLQLTRLLFGQCPVRNRWGHQTLSQNCGSLHGLANRRPEPHHHKITTCCS